MAAMSKATALTSLELLAIQLTIGANSEGITAAGRDATLTKIQKEVSLTFNAPLLVMALRANLDILMAVHLVIHFIQTKTILLVVMLPVIPPPSNA